MLRTLHSSSLQLGASVLEFCICLAIVGALALPAFRGMLELRHRQKLQAVASSLYTDIQYARSESLRSGNTLHLNFSNPGQGSCYWIHVGKTNACVCSSQGLVVCNSTGELLRSSWLPNGSDAKINSNVPRMTFQGDRGTVSSAGTVVVNHVSGLEMRHIVSIMGRIRTCAPNGAGTDLAAC